jgi:hypothetical protein
MKALIRGKLIALSALKKPNKTKTNKKNKQANKQDSKEASKTTALV